MNDEAKNWLKFAKMDLEVAEHLLKNMYPQPIELFVIMQNRQPKNL